MSDFYDRMRLSQGKQLIIGNAFGRVLDLGAGDCFIAEKLRSKGHYVVTVDSRSSKADKRMRINEYLTRYRDEFDTIILSSVLHELDEHTLEIMRQLLDVRVRHGNRIIIREPFYDYGVGPVNGTLPMLHYDVKKRKEYDEAEKLSGVTVDDNQVDALNFLFALAYGPESWEREKHEQRYARKLSWCKQYFDFPYQPWMTFDVIPELDESYKEHFRATGNENAFDCIRYTSMTIFIDY